ncbi:MAG: hypothetical protein R3Y32_09185 [Bacillota bacterium]
MSAKYDRHMNIINSLSDGSRKVYFQLARENCVSVKTIKQDISEMSLFFPLVTYQGRNGGVQLCEGYAIGGYLMKTHYIELIIKGLALLKTENPDPDIPIILSLLSGK